MEQKTARDHIEEAFRILSSLSVSGDAVDAVAAVRFALKSAYNALDSAEPENTGGPVGEAAPETARDPS